MSRRRAMSKRREPGEIVIRLSGSCFLGRVDDGLDCVRIPAEGEEGFGEPDPCFCDDDNCREWPDVQVVCGPHAGDLLPHLPECLTVDIDHAAAQRVIGCLLVERDAALADNKQLKCDLAEDRAAHRKLLVDHDAALARVQELEEELLSAQGTMGSLQRSWGENLAEAQAQVNVLAGHLGPMGCPPNMVDVCKFSHGNCLLWTDCWKTWAEQAAKEAQHAH